MTEKIRHLISQPRRKGGPPRYYWQPPAALRAAGWRIHRLPDDPVQAAAKAEALNAEVDAWRRGELPPDAPAAATARMLGAKAAPAAGTVSALIRDYKASRFWTKLAPRTKATYGDYLDAIEEWAGAEQVRAITPPAVQAFYEGQLERTAEPEAPPSALPAEPVWMTLAEYAKARGLTRDALHKAMRAGRLALPVRRDETTKRGTYRVLVSPADLQAPAARVVRTPAKAAMAVRVLRLLLQNAERLGYLPPGANPARRPGLSTERQRDPVLWSPAQVRHMAATADEMGWRSVATAILLNEWLGQRESDILALKPWKVEAESLQLQQGKRKRIVRLPVHVVPHLVARLRGEAERPGAVASLEHLLLHDRTGQAWGEHTFRHIFAEVRARAAQTMPDCADLRFMELRHTAVTRLHEAGVDELGIAGITGHSPRTVREILDRHYLVRTERAAERAFRLRLAAEAEQ